ncbi:hypothetical protein AVEN_230806-1 [Araneus ventricosus]|uniref:Uncharacterized protein n=1 Tax=Araneus ventricosus TaxID=182803 RepID=A0A4Y2A249_ARAVE|nr:hypothetical protein AVEN_230806-1 [Araneus ventricosus]
MSSTIERPFIKTRSHNDRPKSGFLSDRGEFSSGIAPQCLIGDSCTRSSLSGISLFLDFLFQLMYNQVLETDFGGSSFRKNTRRPRSFLHCSKADSARHGPCGSTRCGIYCKHPFSSVFGLEVSLDKTWIVLYCPLLTKIFNAHIEIEYCNFVESIEYVCKYVNKGSDMAVFELTSGENDLNEIQQYQMRRSFRINEAVWRILNFPIQERHPTVIHLNVHLENGQRVYFMTENAAYLAKAPEEATPSFRLCTQEEFALTLLHYEVPKYYN